MWKLRENLLNDVPNEIQPRMKSGLPQDSEDPEAEQHGASCCAVKMHAALFLGPLLLKLQALTLSGDWSAGASMFTWPNIQQPGIVWMCLAASAS